MSPLPDRLVIATRQSRLALWQSEHVKARLEAIYPGCRVELLPMSTQGDRILDRSLAAIGGKGLFIKELEVALERGEADLAVHSCKDMPVEVPDGFELAAIGEREDPRDAFVSVHHASIESLPAGARVGTASLRREAQLRARRPDLVVSSLRGNLDTRLARLDRGEYEAIILAAAGLRRLGLVHRITALIDPRDSLPAVGQGALAIEIRAGREDLRRWLAPLEHPVTSRCVRAERAASRSLGGSCQMPLAVHATEIEGRLHLEGLVASRDGQRVARAQWQGSPADPEQAGLDLAAALRADGAEAILAALPEALPE
jgi:hydroxymethylbilane synthase